MTTNMITTVNINSDVYTDINSNVGVFSVLKCRNKAL